MAGLLCYRAIRSEVIAGGIKPDMVIGFKPLSEAGNKKTRPARGGAG